MTIDQVDKAAEYMAIGSVAAYAVFSQEEPRAWIWSRGETAWPQTPDEIRGSDASMEVPTLGLMLHLAPIYKGIGR